VTVAEAARLIRAGKLVAFPTETVYGLGANALDPEAVARIFAVKGRPKTSPLIVHVDSPEMARSLAARWPAAADELARRYWPGPLTLVVPKDPRIPDAVTAGLPTVGLRVPAHPLALELIRAAGLPIAAPSANRFTELSPTTAEHVRKSLGDSVDGILDGGPAPVGIESIVLSLAGDEPVLFRPGIIPLPELEEVAGPIRLAAGVTAGPHASPGMHARHYRPATPLYLGTPPGEGRGFWLWLGTGRHEGAGLVMPSGARGYAAVLYETLHRLDERGHDWIAVEPPPETPEWSGVLDRLRRAASA
jgi:L-threonylcarbamoyladenylate synthase